MAWSASCSPDCCTHVGTWRFQKRLPITSLLPFMSFCIPLHKVGLGCFSGCRVGRHRPALCLLMGRELQRRRSVTTVCIDDAFVEGLDGVQEMSKSLNNYIGTLIHPMRCSERSCQSQMIWCGAITICWVLDPEDIANLKAAVEKGKTPETLRLNWPKKSLQDFTMMPLQSRRTRTLSLVFRKCDTWWYPRSFIKIEGEVCIANYLKMQAWLPQHLKQCAWLNRGRWRSMAKRLLIISLPLARQKKPASVGKRKFAKVSLSA